MSAQKALQKALKMAFRSCVGSPEEGLKSSPMLWLAIPVALHPEKNRYLKVSLHEKGCSTSFIYIYSFLHL